MCCRFVHSSTGECNVVNYPFSIAMLFFFFVFILQSVAQNATICDQCSCTIENEPDFLLIQSMKYFVNPHAMFDGMNSYHLCLLKQ